MALGGYKFAGYKCTKASEMSNADLALLIHKTRLKAFVEACAKANANWHFCKNSGTHDFEGETGVIYNIIGVTSDFVSFFQYENENKYFAIITCPEITDDIFHDKARGKGYYEGDNTNRYLWTYRTMFHCASVSPLDADFFIKQSQQTLNSNGELYAIENKPSSLYLSTLTLASYVYGTSGDIPYAALRLVTHELPEDEMRTTAPLLNSDGITSKGYIDVDLIVGNITNGYASLKACGAYANGNYLLACKDYSGYQQYYVGWDPSNPDITLESSWPEYTLS